MFNLLRMDLYRVRRSKSVYICFGILLAATVSFFGLLWLMAMPKGQELAIRIGMLTAEEAAESASILKGVDSLVMFRQTCLDGGMYSATFGVWVMLFVCADFQSGFIKNIMALYQNRWYYVGSKIMTTGIVNFCYLILHLLFTLLVNRLFGNMVPYADLGDYVFYMSWAWFVTTAFAVLVVLLCVLTRSTAAGAIGVVLLGSGAVVMPLYRILDMFHIGSWLKHSIYLTLAMGPGEYTAWKDLHVYAVGAGFLILYTVVTGIVLRRQDI